MQNEESTYRVPSVPVKHGPRHALEQPDLSVADHAVDVKTDTESAAGDAVDGFAPLSSTSDTAKPATVIALEVCAFEVTVVRVHQGAKLRVDRAVARVFADADDVGVDAGEKQGKSQSPLSSSRNPARALTSKSR